MLNRRSLLASVGGLILGGCAARATGLPTSTSSGSSGSASTAAPNVGPAPSWNGTALSGVGGVAPVDPTRTTAKPAMCWLSPGNLRLWQDRVLVVDADANGGMAWVQLEGDCATTRVTSPSIYTYTDPTGATRSVYGYVFNLKASLWTAVSATGAARVFARGHANDGTMQERVIGFPLSPTNGIYDWAMTLYPRTSESDFAHTIGPTIGDYPTIPAFLNAARAANAEAPKGTFVETANYEAADGTTGYTGTTNAKGWCTLTHASGIKATISRAAAFDGNTPTSWYWRPGWPGIEFRGSGVILDLKNWAYIRNQQSCFFNGCRVTCSRPDWATYWNAGAPPGFGVFDDSANPMYSFHIDGIYEFRCNSTGFNLLVSGTKMRSSLFSPFDGTSFVIGTYTESLSSEILHTAYNALTVSCSVAGSPTINVTRPNLSPGSSVILTDANGAQTIVLGDHPAAGNMKISDLAATINARPGWSATVISDTLGSRFLVGTGGAVSVSSTRTFQVMEDIHTEWYHAQQGTNWQNVIHRNNISHNCYWSSEAYNGEGAMLDVIIKGNVFDAQFNGSFDNGGVSYIASGSGHIVVANNSIDGGWDFTKTWDHYSVFTRNVTDYTVVGSTYPTSAPTLTYNSLTVPAGTPAVPLNNFLLASGPAPADTGFQTWFTNKTAGDFRPTGSALTNLSPRLDLYDGRCNQRATNDVSGAWAIGYSAPTYFNFAA